MKFILALLIFTNTLQAKEQLRAVTVSTLPAPLILNSRISTDGLVSDYLKALAEELNADLTIELLSRQRIDAKEETFDINCYTSYMWNYRPDDFSWSKPLYFKKEIIAGIKPVPATLNDFSGENIGTLTGYKYPSLEKLFREKKLLRNDVEIEEQNFQKLINKRISYIVSDEMLIAYFRKNNPLTSKIIQSAYLIEGEFPIQCAIRKSSKLTVTRMNQAIDALLSSGKMEQIFKRYR